MTTPRPSSSTVLLAAFRDFLRLGSASGILLMAAGVLALILANSPLAATYARFVDLPVAVQVGSFALAKPLLLWINDGLMAVFFLLVGLELKREILEGELSDRQRAALPAFAAVGGMALPALIYAAIAWGDPVAMRGWAIPAATDIAFALGILSLLGDRVPIALKAFLVSLAIFDDVGAILIIALFYTAEISLGALAVAALCAAALWLINRQGTTEVTPYLLVGAVMWVAVLKSGIHATLVGVVVALFIPMRDPRDPESSPLRRLEHDLHTAVAFGILPLFAFANAGVSLTGIGLDALLHPVPLGVAAGLVLGKQLGVFGFAWLGVRTGLARLPEGVTWRSIYGVSLLSGVGFTMSLFIGSLAFGSLGAEAGFDERLGIIGGSLVAGLAGFLVLRRVLPRSGATAEVG